MAKKVLKTSKAATKTVAKTPVKSPAKKSVTKSLKKVSAAKTLSKSAAKPAAKSKTSAKVAKPMAGKKVPAAKSKTPAKAAKPVASKKVSAKAPVAKKPAPKKVAAKPATKPAGKLPAKTSIKTAIKTPAKPAPKKPVKAARLTPTAEPVALPVDWTDDKLKTVKTGLSKKDLQTFRDMLLQQRTEIVGDVQSMEDARTVSAGDLSHMPLHMADVGSDNYDQEFTIGIMESERKMLREIDEALARMDRGIYGVCMESGKAIERNRLEAVPWTKYSKVAAERREKQAG